MEALTAASVACLTIYDMAKAVDRAMVISGIRLVEKTGGKSGDYKADRQASDGAASGCRSARTPARRRGAARQRKASPLLDAADRVLAEPVVALRTQPPFDASAMDGYAARAADVASVPARLSVIGTAPAGRGFAGAVGEGQAVRIFTGAPLPEGADTIVIQENVTAISAAAASK